MSMAKDVKTAITIEQAINLIGTGRAQLIILSLTAGGYLAVCSEILVCVFSQEPCSQRWGVSKQGFAWLFFITALASVIGGLISGYVSDKYGRQLPFIIALGTSGCFGLASAFANSFWSFVLLRSFVSFGNGALFVVDFVLLIEFLPLKNRASFIILVTLGGSIGAAYTAGMAWLFIPNDKWKIFLICSAIPLFFVFLARLCFKIESPRYLLSIGKHEKALRVLDWIANQNAVALPLEDFTLVISNDAKKYSFFELFSKEYAVQTIKLSLIWFLQSTGYWGCTAFFPNYFTEFDAPVYLNMFVNICSEIPGFFFAMILINTRSIGRLWTLRIFSLGCMAALLSMTFFQTKVAVSVLSVISYFFMVPIYAIMEVYTPECYPTLLRGTMMSLVNLVLTVPNMVAAFLAARILSSSKHWLFPLVWAITYMLQLVIGMTLEKETIFSSLDEGTNGRF